MTSYLYGAAAALLALLLGLLWWNHHELANVRLQLQREHTAAGQAAAVTHSQIVTAQGSKADELHQIDVYRIARPAVPVRLCRQASSVPATGTPPAASSAAPAGVLPVPPADTGLREQPGRDISGLLSDLAAAADTVAANLREQQAVK